MFDESVISWLATSWMTPFEPNCPAGTVPVVRGEILGFPIYDSECQPAAPEQTMPSPAPLVGDPCIVPYFIGRNKQAPLSSEPLRGVIGADGLCNPTEPVRLCDDFSTHDPDGTMVDCGASTPVLGTYVDPASGREMRVVYCCLDDAKTGTKRYVPGVVKESLGLSDMLDQPPSCPENSGPTIVATVLGVPLYDGTCTEAAPVQGQPPTTDRPEQPEQPEQPGQTGEPAESEPGMSTGKKVAIGLAVVAAIGIGAWLINGGKKR